LHGKIRKPNWIERFFVRTSVVLSELPHFSFELPYFLSELPHFLSEMTHDASAWLNGRACPYWRQSPVLAEMARDSKSLRFALPQLMAAPAECLDAALRGREALKRWVLCKTDWAAALSVATKAALALRVAGAKEEESATSYRLGLEREFLRFANARALDTWGESLVCEGQVSEDLLSEAKAEFERMRTNYEVLGGRFVLDRSQWSRERRLAMWDTLGENRVHASLFDDGAFVLSTGAFVVTEAAGPDFHPTWAAVRSQPYRDVRARWSSVGGRVALQITVGGAEWPIAHVDW
jgi:hypothetical protein